LSSWFYAESLDGVEHVLHALHIDVTYFPYVMVGTGENTRIIGIGYVAQTGPVALLAPLFGGQYVFPDHFLANEPVDCRLLFR
jgi:hypothetical protein